MFDKINEQSQEQQVEELNNINQLTLKVDDIKISSSNNESKITDDSSNTTTNTVLVLTNNETTRNVIKEFYDNLPKDKKERKTYLKNFKQSIKQERSKLKEIKKSMKYDTKTSKVEKKCEKKCENKCAKNAKYGRRHNFTAPATNGSNDDYKQRKYQYKYQSLQKKRVILLTKLQHIDSKLQFFNSTPVPAQTSPYYQQAAPQQYSFYH
ncbi:hypothetical protein DICPUDRAFT_156972 [Dictyostelium purpureum]|uniref:Uncharacterized protein n=1 Tax=Dictyostelium purpureum TaxID=5786 RepID=F0ZXX7_DICPU|nr:uncharacterized protein DICPUDRAFT_156972 [Dictyostelium purpureum]EGC31212.1 hypothetical protein DICPUDRAFT_156972 [Dictyostelium purpureum]|eukprot:XP_003292272.1 hypothetical protein DICPUDRAFT_156972 [Dictyostelium purpureum]